MMKKHKKETGTNIEIRIVVCIISLPFQVFTVFSSRLPRRGRAVSKKFICQLYFWGFNILYNSLSVTFKTTFRVFFRPHWLFFYLPQISPGRNGAPLFLFAQDTLVSHEDTVYFAFLH